MDEKLIEYLVDNVKCTEDEAKLYLEAENEFFIVNGVDIDFEELDEDSFDDIPETDFEEFASFIMEKTGLDAELVEQIADAETDYLEEN